MTDEMAKAAAFNTALKMVSGTPEDKEARIRQRSDEWVECPQTRAAAPIQLRPGTDDGEISILIHTRDSSGAQIGHMVEVRASDLRTAIDLAEVA